MARRKSIAIKPELEALIRPRRLNQLGRQSGFIRRQRKIKLVPFIWSLILGFGAGQRRTIASLRRLYEAETGQRIVPSAFYDRFTPALAKLLRMLIAETITKMVAEPQRRLRGTLAGFRDLLVADASVIKLHDLLASKYPGTRSNSPAAAKLHMVMSVNSAGPRSVSFTSERVNERRRLKLGPWLAGRLLLFDLGYYCHALFDRIDHHGGFFISRLHSNVNAEIKAVHLRHRGQSIDLQGLRIRDVLGRLHRQVIDCEAELRVQRRRYRGKASSAKRSFRLVGVRNEETGQYHLYVTNIPVESLSAEQVATSYRARWEIELIFRELKSFIRLDDLPSRKAEAVECFFYASILALIVSRRLLWAVRRKLGQLASRVTHMRWTSLFRNHALAILTVMVNPPRHTKIRRSRLGVCLVRQAVDPHVNRPGLLTQIEWPEEALA